MSLQLIFVVETNKKCNSDWIYIKDTIEHFYSYEQTMVKFTPVYMDGKGKYKNKEKQIEKLIAKYKAGGKNNETRVIYCFDCDEYNTKQEDAEFLKMARQYCEAKAYDFVWFDKDIECVYTGEKVKDSEKKKRATVFKAKKEIDFVKPQRLSTMNYQENSSNLMLILDKYLTRKRK